MRTPQQDDDEFVTACMVVSAIVIAVVSIIAAVSLWRALL